MFRDIETERCLIRVLDSESAPLMLDYVMGNRTHLSPWEPIKESQYYTEVYWLSKARQVQREAQEGSGFYLIALNHQETEILGQCHFSNIIRGPFEACHLGYSIARAHQGKGLMEEILKPCIRFVFDELGLHRIMANYMPTNLRSERLLNKLGFEREGYAKQYLKIQGKWQDHVLTALVDSR